MSATEVPRFVPTRLLILDDRPDDRAAIDEVVRALTMSNDIGEWDVQHATSTGDALDQLRGAADASMPFAIMIVDPEHIAADGSSNGGIRLVHDAWEHDPELRILVATPSDGLPWADLLSQLGSRVQWTPVDVHDTLGLRQSLLVAERDWSRARWQSERIAELERKMDAPNDGLEGVFGKSAQEYVDAVREKLETEQSLEEKVTELEQLTNDLVTENEQRKRVEKALQDKHTQYQEIVDELVEYANEVRASSDRIEAISRAKTDFLTNMNHELRTPLNAILGFVSTLRGDPSISEADRQSMLAILERNGEHLLFVIGNILDLVQLEDDALPIETAPCDLDALLREVYGSLESAAKGKGLDATLDCTDDLPGRVECDARRVRQILRNICDNAVRFTETGRVAMEVRLIEGDERPSLRVRIIDSGCGIDESCRDAIFQAFQQADNSTSRTHDGVGVGLTLSSRIADAMGGHVRLAQSSPDGSTFEIVVPVDVLETSAEPTPATPKSAAAADDTSDLDGLRVLYVEDGLDNQRLVSVLLKKVGVDVTLAENGLIGYHAAMDAVAAETPFDLILMDMQMPEMDGYEATRKLREESYDGSIVALTAHAMTGDRERCLEAGCDHYETKPINKQKLYAVVRSYAKRSRVAAAGDR